MLSYHLYPLTPCQVDVIRVFTDFKKTDINAVCRLCSGNVLLSWLYSYMNNRKKFIKNKVSYQIFIKVLRNYGNIVWNTFINLYRDLIG